MGAIEAEEAQLIQLDLLHRRHKIYSGIVGKNIDLRPSGHPGRTDCDSYIGIPFEDAEAGLIHQHEWGHILFKSDLRARSVFVEQYLRRMEVSTPGVFGVPLAKDGKNSRTGIEDFLHAFINGLDDLRVCSLWEDPYPQSAEDMQNRWRRILVGTKSYAQNITMYMMALGLGLKHESGQLSVSSWKRYEAILLDGATKVRKTAFPACLVIARWMLDSIIEDVIALHTQGGESYKMGVPSPAKSLKKRGVDGTFNSQDPFSTIPVTEAFTKILKGQAIADRNPQFGLMDTKDTPIGPDPNSGYTHQIVDAALGISTDAQVQALLKDAQLEIERVILDLKGRTRQLSPTQKLLKGLEGRVEFYDVEPKEVEELKLQPGDQRIVQVLHQEFSKLRGRRRLQMSDTGADLDVRAYIDLKMGSGDADIFEEEENARGFSALILIDMSGSMKSRWAEVSRACKVLVKAMKFPYAKVEVWGFSSSRKEATIFRFQDVEKGYSGSLLESKIWGMTPLHLASEVAIRQLCAMSGTSKNLFILTDGIPVHHSTRTASIEDLIIEMSFHITEGRKKNVHTSGLILGHSVEDEIADLMFGHRRFWSRVDIGDLFPRLVSLVRSSFVRYLKGS